MLGTSQAQSVCAEQDQDPSLTFVLSAVLQRSGCRALLGLLLAAQPVQPPPPELPELQVAGREPERAVPLQGRLLQRIRAPSPARLLLLRGRPTRALLDDQARPLQQQEAAGHQVSCCEEEEQKLDPTEKLLQPEESFGHALIESGPSRFPTGPRISAWPDAHCSQELSPSLRCLLLMESFLPARCGPAASPVWPCCQPQAPGWPRGSVRSWGDAFIVPC